MKIKVKSIWFSDTINPWHALGITEYQRSKTTTWKPGFVRELFYTKLIDLQRSEEDILAGFSAETRRLVRKAGKEGITYDVTADMDAFVRFFNTFASQKKLSYRLNAETLKERTKNYKITRAVKDGEVLFSHLYLCDDEKSRATLHYGASILRSETRAFSNTVISSANRGLHYFDMCILKAAGYAVYDMGGYAPDTRDPELKRINEFKDEFGGELVCEANYFSLPLHIASKALNYFVARKRKAHAGKAMSDLARARLG